MRHPAREKKGGGCLRQVHGTNRRLAEEGGVEVVAHVIQGHDHHDQPADQVNGIEPAALARCDHDLFRGAFWNDVFLQRGHVVSVGSADLQQCIGARKNSVCFQSKIFLQIKGCHDGRATSREKTAAEVIGDGHAWTHAILLFRNLQISPPRVTIVLFGSLRSLHMVRQGCLCHVCQNHRANDRLGRAPLEGQIVCVCRHAVLRGRPDSPAAPGSRGWQDCRGGDRQAGFSRRRPDTRRRGLAAGKEGCAVNPKGCCHTHP